MNKKMITTALSLFLFTPFFDHSALADSQMPKILLNDKPVSFSDNFPYINPDGNTMVPLRLFSENLGYQVTWSPSDQGITITKNKTTLSFHIGDTTALVNGKSVPIGTKAALVNNYTFVPLRFLSESFQSIVEWDPDTWSVDIIQPDESKFVQATVKLDGGHLNIRRDPALSGDILGELTNGESVTIKRIKGNWAYVTNANGLSGYSSLDYLSYPQATSKNKIIVIDPGHGGIDPGATGVDGTPEKDINFAYASAVQDALEKQGYTVYLTRPENNSCTDYGSNKYTDLDCRIQMAVDKKADIFVSIHSNSIETPSVQGTEVYYNARNDYDGYENPFPEQSKQLATSLHDAILPAIQTVDHGIFNRSYYVNRMAKVPSVLVEMAYVSNKDDLNKLESDTFKANFVKGFVQGINHYFGFNT